MKILAIETSCDETAVSVVVFDETTSTPKIDVLGQALFSQIDIHAPYGGVYPNLAKRAHAENLVPILLEALSKAGLAGGQTEISKDLAADITKTLAREPNLATHLLEMFSHQGRPNIDAIAVTAGPGLEPALWVGINFAKALSAVWQLPIYPTNHMEGHIASVLADPDFPATDLTFPALALLISGGHTDLVRLNGWADYALLGSTIDDAVGEAYDKVARMLELPYPGGPEVFKLAETHRKKFPDYKEIFNLPRPMLQHDNLDFSFAGLKTAVLYRIKNGLVPDSAAQGALAREFEQAVADTLIGKIKKALRAESVNSLIVAGGVSANTFLRHEFIARLTTDGVNIIFPPKNLSTDNATMIAIAAALRIKAGMASASPESISAEGHVKL